MPITRIQWYSETAPSGTGLSWSTRLSTQTPTPFPSATAAAMSSRVDSPASASTWYFFVEQLDKSFRVGSLLVRQHTRVFSPRRVVVLHLFGCTPDVLFRPIAARRLIDDLANHFGPAVHVVRLRLDTCLGTRLAGLA